MATYLYIVQIILSVTLIIAVIFQAKGGGLGSVFGGDSGVYKSRRGVEKTLFNVTIGLSVAFFVVALITVLVTG